MSGDSGRSYQQGEQAAKRGLDAAGRAGRSLGRAGRKLGGAAAKGGIAVTWKFWAIVIGILILFILMNAVLSGGTSETSLDATNFLTAQDSEVVNAPENEDEFSSVYTKRQSLKITEELAAVISEAKMNDRQKREEKLRDQLTKSGYSEIIIECDSDKGDVYVCNDVGDGTPYSDNLTGVTAGAGAEKIAQTAERFAWPETKGSSTYDYDKGGQPTEAFRKAWKKYYNKKIYDAACCCHSAKTVLSDVYGHKMGGILPMTMSKEEAKKKIEKSIRHSDCEVIEWDGDLDSLRRGDVCTYRKSLNMGHVYVYLGNKKAAHGSRTNNYFMRVSGMNKSAKTKSGKAWYFIIRSTGPGPVSSASFSPASEYTKLGTISPDDGERYSLSPPSGKPIAQSFAYTDSSYGVAFTDGPTTGTYGTVRGFSMDGKVIKDSDVSAAIYHANASAVTSDGSLLVAGSLKSGRKDKAVEFTQAGGKFSKKGDFKLPADSSALAYDRETGKYICATANTFHVYDKTLKNEIATFKRDKHGTYYQDIGAGCGYIFACHSVKKGGAEKESGENYVDVYEESSGSYCGSYKVDYGELESADVVNGELVLLIHIKGDHKNYIHKTGIIVSSNPYASFNGGVTENDLDILSAYSVSLANTALRYDKDGETETVDDMLFSKRYVDINGKPVKTYWFGEDKGKINYVGDLKKKVKGVSYYKEKTETVEAGKSIKVTLSEKKAHELCEEMFGVDPNAEYINAQSRPGKKTGESQIVKPVGDTQSAYESTLSDEEKKAWYLRLVNNDHAMPDGYSPELANLDASYISTGNADDESRNRVDSRIYDSLMKMLDACREAGYDPRIISAYRTNATQRTLYDNAKDKSDTAVPGHSEHECGLAVDIVDADSLDWTDPLVSEQEGMPAQMWLMKHCAEYGFILRYPRNKQGITEIIYEPWHYRFVGTTAAKTITNYGLCLEEYLGETGGREEEENATPAAEDGITTNAEVIYSLSANTAHLLYTDKISKEDLIGSMGLYPGGTMNFPLPPKDQCHWVQTDVFQSQLSIRGGRKHDGVDIGCATGTPVYAACGGLVKIAKNNYVPGVGYGKYVVIQSGNTEVYYGHLSKIEPAIISLAGKGSVQPGTKLGEVGSTGHSTGPHLHFEVRVNGVPVNPAPYLGNGIK